MLLTSTAFQQGGSIPKRYTCEGENNSPSISWTDVPPETVSFVLILHDPRCAASRRFRIGLCITFLLKSAT